MSSSQDNNAFPSMNDIPSELLTNILENLSTQNEEQHDSNDSTEDEEFEDQGNEDDDDDYDYIDNLEDDFDINLMDEIDYKDILSNFFETKDGDNIAEVLSSVKHSIDQNSKCIMKLCKIIENFSSFYGTDKNSHNKATSPKNKK